MRVLIVSNMDAAHPYGAWTRPYYIGQYLAEAHSVFQVGYNCAGVAYGNSISVGGKSIPAYIRAINRAIEEYCPDIIYAHETFPGIAASIASTGKPAGRFRLVLDFHAASAHEYLTMFNHYQNRFKALALFLKAYFPQRYLASRGQSIIAASPELKELVTRWYRVLDGNVHVIPNGTPPEYIEQAAHPRNPYPERISPVLVVAPKNMMPNILSVRFVLEVAAMIEKVAAQSRLQIMIAGGGWQRSEVERSSNVKYLGFVEELLPYIDYADLCLLPFSEAAVCGGARNKALDFFARGKLVLSTSEGLRGLPDFRHQEHVLISSYDPRKFAADLVAAAEQSETYAKLGVKARMLIKQRYNWRCSANSVASYFEHLLGKEVHHA